MQQGCCLGSVELSLVLPLQQVALQRNAHTFLQSLGLNPSKPLQSCAVSLRCRQEWKSKYEMHQSCLQSSAFARAQHSDSVVHGSCTSWSHTFGYSLSMHA